ncbi:MAG: glycosyltransferase family 9 protein [Candidatus Brocadia sp.]|jgi:ADP-heptose:LPS heptosyltransferase
MREGKNSVKEMTEFDRIKNSKRILFVHQFLAMGDAILLIPVYKTIKDNISGIEISVLTNEYSMPFVKATPFVDHVYPFESIFRRGASRMEVFLRLCMFFIKNRIDTIVLRGDKRLPQRAFNLAAKICLLQTVSMGSHLEEEVSEGRHIVEVYFRILEKLGFEIKERGCLFLTLPDSAVSEAKDFLKNMTGKLVGIAPVSNIKIKNWTPEKTAELIHKLKELSYDVVLFCADKEFLQDITIGNNELVVGQVDFSLLMGIVSLCKIFIGVDTGPTHLAAAIGVPTIGLYGPTSGTVAGPYSKKGTYIQSSVACHYYNPLALFSPKERPMACYLEDRCKLPANNCMNGITIEEVMEAIHRIIQ